MAASPQFGCECSGGVESSGCEIDRGQEGVAASPQFGCECSGRVES